MFLLFFLQKNDDDDDDDSTKTRSQWQSSRKMTSSKARPHAQHVRTFAQTHGRKHHASNSQQDALKLTFSQSIPPHSLFLP